MEDSGLYALDEPQALRVTEPDEMVTIVCGKLIRPYVMAGP
jgi:hypothetical protein